MSDERIKQLLNAIEYEYPRGQAVFNRCKCGNNISRGDTCAKCLELQLAELIGLDKAEYFHKKVRKLSELYHRIVNGDYDD